MYISKFNRAKYDNFLDDSRNPIGVVISNIILGLLLIFIASFIFESIGDNATKYASILYKINLGVSGVFLLEYIFRLCTTRKLSKFLVSPARFVDLLSFLPFFLGMSVGAIDFGKFLRLLRVLSVLRLVKRIPLTGGFLKSLKEYRDEYYAVFLLFFIILLLGSVFVYYFEKDITGTNFTSVPASLWWGLVTLTTVGFGDMVPTTYIGKAIASVMVFISPLLVGLFSAVTFMVFTEASKTQKIHRIGKTKCQRCEELNLPEAVYCMKCGERLEK